VSLRTAGVIAALLLAGPVAIALILAFGAYR
jgi:hypothetical protein